MALGTIVLRNTAAGAALLAAGVGIGEADFKPTVPYLHTVTEARQIQASNTTACNRLDAVDSEVTGNGQLEAFAAPASEPWCWQVNGRQVPRSQTVRCNRLDAIASALVGVRRDADGLDYESAHWRATKLSGAVCWQTEATMQIPTTCTPD